jgi:hypothetical protein
MTRVRCILVETVDNSLVNPLALKKTVPIQLTDFADEDTATDGHLGSEGALLVCKRFKNE